jgi:hypothetical protein
MCGPFFFGFWWIVPLIGFAMCIGFMAFRGLGAGRGFMCMGGHGDTRTDHVAEHRQ